MEAKSVAEIADETAFKLLFERIELPKELMSSVSVFVGSLNLDENQAIDYFCNDGIVGLNYLLLMRIQLVCTEIDFDIALKVAKETAKAVKVALENMGIRQNYSEDDHGELLDAFALNKFCGDADEKFIDYLKRCWRAYSDKPHAYVAPFVALVQSSGFGKSRVVFEVAKKTMKNKDSGMKVLYACIRKGRSSAYPRSTNRLRDRLLGSTMTASGIKENLVAIYHYAQQNWSSIGEEWLHLFTSADADSAVNVNLSEAKATLKNRTATLASKRPTDSSDSGRVVILAVDSARNLLKWNPCGIEYLKLLCSALVEANERIRRAGFTGGIFAVLLGGNPDLSGLTLDLTERYVAKTLFPPFVLTHTMDCHWRAGLTKDDDSALMVNDEIPISVYKSLVTEKTEEENWLALISMGRPMWASTLRSEIMEGGDFLLRFAAQKLMYVSAYNKESMFGVTAMLCRLGLSPRFSLPLASRVASLFMATLVYVNQEHGGVLSTYASDPVLALGATRTWYPLDCSLSKHLLPQLKKLLLKQVLDESDTGDVVARIVLLLAMDTCVVMETGAKTHNQCFFAGQFISVQTFLKVLSGDEQRVMASKQKKADEQTVESFRQWQPRWKAWQMGFCYFIRIDCEPNEDTLWYLLARRAAGIFPTGQEGAELLIPMFCGSDVSLILVHVENVVNGDIDFPLSATDNMSPSEIFSDDNAMSKKSPDDMIRVYLSLRENVPEHEPNRFILSYAKDTTFENSPLRSKKSHDSFTFCIRSVTNWKPAVFGKSCHTVISEAVAERLMDLASPWSLTDFIADDLREDGQDTLRLERVMLDEELQAASLACVLPPYGNVGDDVDSTDMGVPIEHDANAPSSQDHTSCPPRSSKKRQHSRGKARKSKRAQR